MRAGLVGPRVWRITWVDLSATSSTPSLPDDTPHSMSHLSRLGDGRRRLWGLSVEHHAAGLRGAGASASWCWRWPRLAAACIQNSPR